ncbi:hypothetical protein JTB14_018508 [Gonioctena quinquepunctata]|nr:hypothetical protein JTB14_018508 [Gonioctena quinquepunctata]
MDESESGFDYLRIFSCGGFVHIPKQNRIKWDTKSGEYIFVGYCGNAKGYHLLDPKDPSKIVRARYVVFIENFGNHQNPVNNNTNKPLHQVLSQESSDEVQGDMVEDGE